MKYRRQKPLQTKKNHTNQGLEPSIEEQKPLTNDLASNESKFKLIYKNCPDLVFRSFYIGEKDKAILIYMEGLSNEEEIDRSVLSPLMISSEKELTMDVLMHKKIPASSIQKIKTFSDGVKEIAAGNPVILVDGQEIGFSVGLAKSEKRSIEEPQAEMVVRGPREGFVESISVNLSLLRKRIRSPKLKAEAIQVGEYTETRIMITYIEGLAGESLIDEVKNRIKRIDVDGILESGMLEEYIEDDPYSPFPQVLATERPDVVTSNLLEGRIAILVDGTPFTIIVPTTLYSLLQSSEDYYDRFMIGTAIRWLRYLFVVISLILPSLYVAFLTFHHEMIPTPLLVSIAASREQVPFPALVEALIMEVIFEALREAGIRLPKQVGSAVSIVGALVIGESAVSAGIISAPMVIVVALTGVASFTIPRYSAANTIRMLRFPMILLAGTLGLLGIILGVILIVVHLATLRSFGEPYLSPMAPMKGKDMKDVLVRAPWWKLNTRPHLTGVYNKHRQSESQKPSPIRGKE